VREESPEDLAWEAFSKVYDNKEAKRDSARVTKTEVNFLEAYPKHREASAALTKMTKVRDLMRDRDAKKDVGLKSSRVQCCPRCSSNGWINFPRIRCPRCQAVLMALDAVAAQNGE